MSLFQTTAEDYLATVKGWEDPMPEPVLEGYEGITVVRDDLLTAGSKARFLDVLISRNRDVQEWIYGASPRVGYGQVSLAFVASKYDKRSTVFLPESKELHPNSKKAEDLGAKIVQVSTGFMGVCMARARAYLQTVENARLVPFGLADDTVYGSIIKVARDLPFLPEIVVTVAGSGVLNRGLQLAWPDAEFYAVSVGHKLTDEERGRATVIRHPLKFAQQCKKDKRPPFPSVLEYDAKAWEYAVQIKQRTKKKVLFWNVAG